MKQMPLLTLTAAALCLSACSWMKSAPKTETPAPAAKDVKKATPTAAQQAAARAALAEQRAMEAEEESLLNTPALPADAPGDTSTGGLRLRRFAPPEEAISSAEGNDIPLPNSAELHGLRSPVLPAGNLPMDINGKLTPTDSQE